MFLKLSLSNPEAASNSTLPDFTVSAEMQGCIFGATPDADWQIEAKAAKIPQHVAQIAFVCGQFHLSPCKGAEIFVNQAGKPLPFDRAIVLRDEDALTVASLSITIRIGGEQYVGRKMRSLESMLRPESGIVAQFIEGVSHTNEPETERPQDPLMVLDRTLSTRDTLDPLVQFLHSDKQQTRGASSALLEDLVQPQAPVQAVLQGNNGHGIDAISVPRPRKDIYGFEEIEPQDAPLTIPQDMTPESIAADVLANGPVSKEDHARLCWERYLTIYNEKQKIKSIT